MVDLTNETSQPELQVSRSNKSSAAMFEMIALGMMASLANRRPYDTDRTDHVENKSKRPKNKRSRDKMIKASRRRNRK